MGNCCIHFCCCCFNNLSSKVSEIILISIHAIAIVLVECCFFIIIWKKISISNLMIFLFILLLNLICLIFAIIIRFWRAKDLIKLTYKNAGTIFSTISLILSIICVILCFIEVILISIDFSNPNEYCQDDSLYEENNICQKYSITLKEILITIITFIYLFIGLILGIIIWALLNIKIKYEIDGSIPLILDKYGCGRKIKVLSLDEVNIKINLYNPGYYFSYGKKDLKDNQNSQNSQNSQNNQNNQNNQNKKNNNPLTDDISDNSHECQIPNNILNHS